MKLVLERLTYANVMSSIAVFLVVAGGTAFAAVELGKESVGTKQLAKEAVSLSKIKKATRNALKGQTGPAGPAGAKGATGPAGPRGATGDRGATGSQGPKGDQGSPGQAGAAGPLVETLPSGKTLRGHYGFAGHHSTGYSPVDSVSFAFPLAAGPSEHVIPIGGASTAECPGTAAQPAAAPGNACVYEIRADGGHTISQADLDEVADGRFGLLLFLELADNTDYQVEGTWAVTAP